MWISSTASAGRWGKQLLRNRLAPFVDQPKPAGIISRRERGAVGDPVLLGGPKLARPVKARPPIIRHSVGMPPCIATFGPDPGVFGGFGCRRRELRLSFAPSLPWRKNAIANRSDSHGGLLVARGAARSRGHGKLNNLAAVPSCALR
jgi:hypothetical protein